MRNNGAGPMRSGTRAFITCVRNASSRAGVATRGLEAQDVAREMRRRVEAARAETDVAEIAEEDQSCRGLDRKPMR
jgi:hypothetical protein